MSSNVLMTRFGKVLLPNRPCCIRPVSLARQTCEARRPLVLRCEAEDAVESVVANDVVVDDVVAQDALANGSTTDLTPVDLTSVTFKLVHHVEFGQTVKVVGATESLGNWQPEVAIPLTWMEGDIWTVDMELPSGPYEYKYLVIDGDGSLLEWYPGENLSADVTSDGVSLENQWNVPVAEPVAEEAPEEETPVVGELVEETEEVETPSEIETPATSEVQEVTEVPEEEEVAPVQAEAEIEIETTVEIDAEPVMETEVEAEAEAEIEIETEAEAEAEAEIVAEAETEIATVSEAVDYEEEEQEEKEEEVEAAKEEEENCVENAVSETELETSAAVESVLDSEATEIKEEEEEEKSFQALSKGFGSPFFKRVKRGNKKN